MSRAVMQQSLEALESTGRFLHHCWCAVSMNDYSFDELNKQIEIVDAEIAALREELAKPELMRMPKKGDRVVFTEDGFTGVVESISPAGGPYIKFDDGTDGQWSLYDFGTMFHYADNTKEKT